MKGIKSELIDGKNEKEETEGGKNRRINDS